MAWLPTMLLSIFLLKNKLSRKSRPPPAPRQGCSSNLSLKFARGQRKWFEMQPRWMVWLFTMRISLSAVLYHYIPSSDMARAMDRGHNMISLTSTLSRFQTVCLLESARVMGSTNKRRFLNMKMNALNARAVTSSKKFKQIPYVKLVKNFKLSTMKISIKCCQMYNYYSPSLTSQ